MPQMYQFLGPKMFNVVKCAACNTQYNAKTGNLNTGAIIAYTVVWIVVIIAVVVIGGSV